MTIPKIAFGRTGHESTRLIFGAAALKAASPAESDRTLELLLRYGINHIDAAPSYGNAELNIAPWFKEHRSRFFLATKTKERTYEGAKHEIAASLKRTGAERLDLIQLHNLSDPIEWDVALSPNGALQACIEAREHGLVRFIGVTGHGSQIAATHLRSLDRFSFDSLLLPYSYVMLQDPHYAHMFERVAERALEQQIAVQTIKAIARRPWWGRARSQATWYEPLTEQADIDAAVHWVLARPGIFLNTVGDLSILPKVLDAAARFTQAPGDATMHDLCARNEMLPLFV